MVKRKVAALEKLDADLCVPTVPFFFLQRTTLTDISAARVSSRKSVAIPGTLPRSLRKEGIANLA